MCASKFVSIVGAALLLCFLGGTSMAQEAAPAEAAAPAEKAVPSEGAAAEGAETAPPVQGKVLLVQSYHPEYEWVQCVTAGVKKVLEGTEVELDVFFMDTKRRDYEKWKREAGKLAKQRVEEFQPDVIVAADDNAQEFCAKDYAGVAGAPQVVFCGVNASPSAYGYPASNVTGVLERYHFEETLELVKKLFPEAEKAAIISDKSTTSDAVMRDLKSRQSPIKIVDMDQPRSFDRWQGTIEQYNKKVDTIGFITYHTVREGRKDRLFGAAEGETISPGRVMRWTIDNTTKPTFAFLPFAVKHGALLGIVESGEEQGRLAAQMVVEILKGKTARELPVKMAEEGSLMINLRTAAKLGVEIPQELLDSADELIR